MTHNKINTRSHYIFKYHLLVNLYQLTIGFN